MVTIQIHFKSNNSSLSYWIAIIIVGTILAYENLTHAFNTPTESEVPGVESVRPRKTPQKASAASRTMSGTPKWTVIIPADPH